MTDAISRASNMEYEEANLKRLKDISLDHARKIKDSLCGIRPRNREYVSKIALSQIEYYLKNEELKDLNFKICGYACGVNNLIEGGYTQYLEHAKACEKCQEHLKKNNLSVQDVSEIIEKIKSSAPRHDEKKIIL